MTRLHRHTAVALALQAAFQGIRTQDGYVHDIKPTSVVLEPRDMWADGLPLSVLPILVVLPDIGGARQWMPGYEAAWPGEVKDTLAFSVMARHDVTTLSRPNARLIVADQLAGDLERAIALTLAAGGFSDVANDVRLTITRKWMGFGNDPQVFVQGDISVRLAERGYGDAFVEV